MGVLKIKQDNIQILYMFCPVMVKAYDCKSLFESVCNTKTDFCALVHARKLKEEWFKCCCSNNTTAVCLY